MSEKRPTEAKPVRKAKSTGAPDLKTPPSLQPKSRDSSLFNGVWNVERSPLSRAQDLVYDAWEAPTRRQSVALAKKALKISADCADAYTLLAQEAAKSLEEATELCRKAVEAGERALGKEFFEKGVGHFWGILESRPYMRARAALAEHLWEAGEREAAIEHYWDLLRLNPMDNQGIRDLLMPCLLTLGRDKEAEKLYKQYRGDGMAVWLYSRALLDFRKHGDSQKSLKSLQEALAENKHVPAYLVGRRKVPRNLPDHYGFGDDDEAVLYAYKSKAVWEATPGALAWLAGRVR